MDSQEKLTSAHTLRQISVKPRTCSSSSVVKKCASIASSHEAKAVLTTIWKLWTNVSKLSHKRICPLSPSMNSSARFVASMLTAMCLKFMRILGKQCFPKFRASLDPKPLAKPLLESLFAREPTWRWLTITNLWKSKALKMKMMKTSFWVWFNSFLKRLTQEFSLRISLRTNSKQNFSSKIVCLLLVFSCLSARRILARSVWHRMHRQMSHIKLLLFFQSVSASTMRILKN